VIGLMVFLWAWSLRLKNAGMVDIGWTAGLMIMALACQAASPAWWPRSALAAAMVLIWGSRLLLHLGPRVIGRPEDPRYVRMRARRGKQADTFFLGLFLGEGLLAVLLALPLFIVRLNGRPQLSAWEWAGLGLWLIALCGESIADAQLRRFKANTENRGRTCRDGLWKYSRHPNYFFEWWIWVALAIFALDSRWGWTAAICPALMLYFLLRVSGIPLAEEQAIQSRGDEYREYQRTTSAFVPWFPVKDGGR